MKASEMRLGNWYDHNGTPKQVTVSVIEDVWEAQMTWVKPIPLTEEWLLKFGFEVKAGKFGNEYHRGKFALYTASSGAISFVWDRFIKDVPFVHTLQNLHPLLTGEELKLIEP
jgi:hypothetical protein